MRIHSHKNPRYIGNLQGLDHGLSNVASDSEKLRREEAWRAINKHIEVLSNPNNSAFRLKEKRAKPSKEDLLFAKFLAVLLWANMKDAREKEHG